MTEHDQNSVPTRLGFIAGRLNRRLSGATGGLSVGLLSALSSVEKYGPMRLTHLAEVERVTPSSITRVIIELETRGLVERSQDDQDARAVRIRISPDGTQAILRARSARADVIGELFGELSPEEIASIAAAIPALERLIEHT